jgi:flagellum-specific ATP synthase
VRVAGLVLEAAGIRAPVGAVCEVHADGGPPVQAEVVGFDGDRAFLMPTGEVHGLASGARVLPRPAPAAAPRLGAENHPWRRSEDRGLHLPIGDGLLGRVVDPHGQPMDRRGPIGDVRPAPMVRRPINAMDRDPVRTPLDTGVRAINAMLTVGRGQRIGLFAGTGVGKSVLLGMMARYTAADVIVVGLIGERGREVKEFIEDILGAEGLARSVVVAAPADAPPLCACRARLRHRDRRALPRPRPARAAADGLADALRDGAARDRAGDRRAAGHQGLPAELLRQAAAAGRAQRQRPRRPGSITAFYTVLSEGDDQQDPIADAAAASSTATSCCRASSPRRATTRPSTSRSRSRA